MGAFGANSENVPISVTLLTLSSDSSRYDCVVAKNSNADRISALCFIACPRNGVLWFSNDTHLQLHMGTFPTTSLGARQTITRHSVSLPVHEMVFCSLLMTLSSATSHGDFSHNVIGSMLPVCAL